MVAGAMAMTRPPPSSFRRSPVPLRRSRESPNRPSFGYAKRVTNPVASDLAFITANAAYLGRLEEAKANADRIATLDPKRSAEQWLSDYGGFAPEEAELFAEGVRKAGIRACLPATELKERPATRTVNSCNVERASF